MKTTLFLIILSAVVKPINFLKEILIAAVFGAGVSRDAFLVAWQIPNLVGSTIFEGLPQIFVPWLTDLTKKDNQIYTKNLNNVFNLVTIFLLLLSLFVLFTSNFWVSLIVPFASLEVKLLSIKLLDIMSFSILFLGINALFTGLLYSYQIFIVPTLTVPLMNLIIIFSILIGSSKLEIYSLAIGVLIGTLSMVLLQGLVIVKKKIKYKLTIEFSEEVKQLAILGSTFFLGTLIFNLNAVAEKIFASKLPIGSISCLDYAFRIVQLIFTIFIPITVVLFPKLCSCSENQRNNEEFANLIIQGLKTIMFFVLPIAAIIVSLQLPLVKIIYQRGVFTAEMTKSTSELLGIYALGLIPHSLNFMLIHVFYARKEMIVRVKYGVIFLISFVILNLIFVEKLKAYGIALSNSLAAFISTIFLTKSMMKKISISINKLLTFFCKMFLVSLITGLIAWSIWDIVNLRMSLFLTLFISFIVSAMFFFFSAYLLKIEEIKIAKDLILEIVKKWQR